MAVRFCPRLTPARTAAYTRIVGARLRANPWLYCARHPWRDVCALFSTGPAIRGASNNDFGGRHPWRDVYALFSTGPAIRGRSFAPARAVLGLDA